MDICALIMAGGKGTRFWPLSTEEKPKQFLSLIGEKTMIQMTIDRIRPIIPIERIFVCTGERYVNIVKEQLKDLPEKNIIIEPQGRNTAPCIALSSLIIERYYKNSNVVVLPSDHLIRDENQFRNTIIKGMGFLEKNNDAILTLGMKPDRPETGYGYIKCGKDVGLGIRKVNEFVEKPNLELAEEYLKDESYLWNGGMFLWKASYILDEIKRYIPTTYEALNKLIEIKEQEMQKYINTNYSMTDIISIDYAVLEKSSKIFVIPSEFGWDDIGTWNAIERYGTKDQDENIYIGNISGEKSENNVVIASGKKIFINGLNNIYLLENEDSIFIGKKEELPVIAKYRK